MNFKILQHIIKEKNIIIISFIIACFIEVLFFHDSFLIGNNNISIKKEYYNNYDKKDNIYTSLTNDGQIYYEIEEQKIKGIKINLNLINKKSVPIQIFYSNDGNYSEEKSIIKKVQNNYTFELPYPCQFVRVDIGNMENDIFYLKDITFYSDIVNPILIKIIILTFIIFYLLKLSFLIIERLETISQKVEHIVDIHFIVIAFILYLIFSWNILMEYAPDESMRYDISLFIFKNGKLPLGNELELINPTWGFSYGFVPYLPNLLAVIPMKICNLFTSESLYLLRAARLVNVLAGTFTVFMVLRIGNELFNKKFYKYLFVLLTTFLPQFIFLTSYLNNDIFAILSIAIIIYAWITGEKNNYSLKTCIILGIGIGLCALSYYNAYSFILCSIILFAFWLRKNLKAKLDTKLLIKKTGIICFLAIGIAGWFFIRNAILHNGDFLGLNTIERYGELYAVESFKPSNRMTPYHAGISIFEMIFGKFNGLNWIDYTIKSFFGVFGYMNIFLNNTFYFSYIFLLSIGIAGKIIKTIKQKSNKLDLYFLICIIITIGLSIYYSYFSGYQPQGRYCMPILLPIMIFFIEGFAYFENKLEEKKNYLLIQKLNAGVLVLVLYLILLGINGMKQMI